LPERPRKLKQNLLWQTTSVDKEFKNAVTDCFEALEKSEGQKHWDIAIAAVGFLRSL
jgi:hypothetical protein